MILGGSTLLMVGLSWPLWSDGEEFPRIPFVLGWSGWPRGVTWGVLILLILSLGASMIGRAGRWMMTLSLVFLTIEVLGDQNRLQPWVWQYGVIGLAMVAFPRGVALRLARVYAVSLYLYSGLSKLDASFLRELGPTLLSASLAPIGISMEDWSGLARTTAILAMPGFEVALAVGLYFERTRRVALAGAVGLHLALLGVLGPWNLGHSPNVLVWNGAMILEDLCLFGINRSDREPRLGPLARCFVLVLFVFPLGERFGLADSWPSHALYASHCERTEVDLFEADLDRFPESIRHHLVESGEGPWRRLDLTGWSRAVRGTPLYPQGRVGIGIGEWLASGSGGERSVRVIFWSRADAWDGSRDRVECVGLRAIRRRGDRFWINAHPARPMGR